MSSLLKLGVEWLKAIRTKVDVFERVLGNSLVRRGKTKKEHRTKRMITKMIV